MIRSGQRASYPLLTLAVVLALALTACGDDGENGNMTVVATTGVLADVAERVAGPDAEVIQLVPDGSDPHSFSLSAEDRQLLAEADLVVANGAGLEAGIPLEESDAPVWELTAHAGELLAGEGEAEDPHVWMDPTRVAAALPSLADSLANADPANADAYAENARAYARELRELDREIARELDAVPSDRRELVTSHDALAYFADRYGFEVAGSAFPSTGAEAEVSAERLSALEALIAEAGVPAVFAQEGDDPEALETVAEANGVKVEIGLLVESPAPNGSYAEMLHTDAELIAAALGGRAR